MQLIKTVKHFVSGSDKYFDIFQCTVDEVEVSRDQKGRRSIGVKVGDKEFKGLWNKSVEEHLTENEGKESFIVLWKSPKGNHMLSYSWELWERYIKGDTDQDVETRSLTSDDDTGEAFLYMWIDKKTDRKYIGYHKGSLDDGYICSSGMMTEEYGQRPEDFYRTILAWGTANQMYELETILLLELGAATRGAFYNVSNNLRA
jgi:hypothetical protein